MKVVSYYQMIVVHKVESRQIYDERKDAASCNTRIDCSVVSFEVMAQAVSRRNGDTRHQIRIHCAAIRSTTKASFDNCCVIRSKRFNLGVPVRHESNYVHPY